MTSAAGAGAALPGPATGRTGLRYAVAEVTLTPATAFPGGELALKVRLRPRDGFVWHEARLAPARARLRLPDGWKATPSELALPPPGTPTARRRFASKLRAARSIAGDEVLVVELRYGVRRRGEAGPETKDGAAVRFEEAELTVELPGSPPESAPAVAVETLEAADVAEAREAGGPREALPAARAGPVEPTEAASRGEGGSPVLPALFLALAAALVLGGVAAAVRSARAKR